MSAGNKKLTPRQRMITLMYVVLMAMLALNVSSDVHNGFTIVDLGLTRSTDNATKQNLEIFQDFEAQMLKNPEKVGDWYAKAKRVKELSDSAFNYAEELKLRMVQEADGKNANVRNIKNKEDLEAANYIMLSPVTGEGQKLYDLINHYRDEVVTMISDTVQQRIISDNFDTSVPQTENSLGKNWQQYNFENMPVAAAVTLLTKFQNDVRYAEGEFSTTSSSISTLPTYVSTSSAPTSSPPHRTWYAATLSEPALLWLLWIPPSVPISISTTNLWRPRTAGMRCPATAQATSPSTDTSSSTMARVRLCVATSRRSTPWLILSLPYRPR